MTPTGTTSSKTIDEDKTLISDHESCPLAPYLRNVFCTFAEAGQVYSLFRMFVIPDGITNFFPFVTERSPRTSEFPNTRRFPFEVNEVVKVPEPIVEAVENIFVILLVVELTVVRLPTGELTETVAEIEGEVIDVEPVMLVPVTVVPVMLVPVTVVPVKLLAVTSTPGKSAEEVTFNLEMLLLSEVRVLSCAKGEKRFPVEEIEGEVIDVEPVMLFPIMVVTLAVLPTKLLAVTSTPVKSAEEVTFKLEVSTVPNVPLPVTLEEPLTERTPNDPVPETVIEGEVMAEVAARLDPVTTVPVMFPNTTLELVPILCGRERVTAEFSEPEPETRT
jgi:hypothetical protein